MKADKVAMRIQQQVSGIRVEVLNRGYGELEELRVVFDWIDPRPWLVEKVRSLMEEHSFYNTHVNDVRRFICGAFKMVFARATSFGIKRLECMALELRDEIRQAAKQRAGSRNEGLEDNCVKLCPASRAILTALMNAGGVMQTSELVHTVIHDWNIDPDDLLVAHNWLHDHKFVVTILTNRWGIEKVQITRRGRNALKYCN